MHQRGRERAGGRAQLMPFVHTTRDSAPLRSRSFVCVAGGNEGVAGVGMAAAVDDEAADRTAGRQADRQERKRWRSDQKELLDEMLPKSVLSSQLPRVCSAQKDIHCATNSIAGWPPDCHRLVAILHPPLESLYLQPCYCSLVCNRCFLERRTPKTHISVCRADRKLTAQSFQLLGTDAR